MAKVRRLHAASALVADGWATDVLIEIDAEGVITALSRSEAGSHERASGPLIAGMPNVHSHAFQRAMVGLTEKAGPAGDSFWSWREQMYHFLDRLDPDDIEAIAAQLYVEMLEAGYTSVAEFHYLHHDPKGQPYAEPAENGLRIIAAASQTGIGLALLPVFYAHSNFGAVAPSFGQRRFINDFEAFSRIALKLELAAKAMPGATLGIAPHSLRAVGSDDLFRLIALADTLGPETRIHIHAAEQMKEVEDCLAWSGERPLEWLLNRDLLNARWCVVHATHATESEILALARSEAVAGLCPSTEGDLGDGIFEAVRFLGADGRFGIGGDSHVGVDPMQELRLFEFGQRLKHQRRNVLAQTNGQSLGGRLYRSAAEGGAQALGQKIGAIAPGLRADLVTLNLNDATLMAHTEDGLLDAAIFGPVRRAIDDVMVGGEWLVRGGHHRDADRVRQRFGQTMRRLLERPAR